MALRPLAPGTFFAVPFNDDFVLAVVARHRTKPARIMFAYYFAPLFSAVPSVESVPHMYAQDAVYATLSGDQPFRDGRWQVIGVPKWSRTDMWPFPEFRTVPDMATAEVRCICYSEDDLLTPVGSRKIPASEALVLPETGVADGAFVETRLQRRLKEHAASGLPLLRY